jgi:hypothetical protein
MGQLKVSGKDVVHGEEGNIISHQHLWVYRQGRIDQLL